MQLPLIIFATFFALAFASPTTIEGPRSIIDSLSQLLYVYLNPTLQNTLQQLIQLVFELGDKLFHAIEPSFARAAGATTALWASELFGEVTGIANLWNNHVTQFFTNIPTIFEPTSRSVFDFSVIRQKLHEAVGVLFEELKQLFVNNVNGIFISIIDKYALTQSIGRKREELQLDVFFRAFELQVSGVFEKMKEQLNNNIDSAIRFIVTYWNGLKDRLLGWMF